MSHTVSDSAAKDIIREQFDDHFLWLTESKGGHTPSVSTAKFVIRQYLSKKKPDISSSQIEKYFTSNNIDRVMKLLERFYKEKGVFVAKAKPSRSPSSGSKRKTSRTKKSPKRKTAPKRKAEKESRKAKSPKKPKTVKRTSVSSKRKPGKESRRAGKDSRHRKAEK